MRKGFYIVLTTTFCLVSEVNVNAQNFEPRTTFNVELSLPGAMANTPFKNIMQGLASCAVYSQYSFPFHLNIGAGVKYALFTVNEFAVPSPIYGNIQSGTGFLKIGHDKFHTDQFATDIGVKVGYSEHFVLTDVNKANDKYPLRLNSTTVETTLGLILSVDERNSYRLVLGHGIHGFGFDPYMIGLDSNEGYDPEGFNKLTQYFLVGFGYTLYFNGQKTD